MSSSWAVHQLLLLLLLTSLVVPGVDADDDSHESQQQHTLPSESDVYRYYHPSREATETHSTATPVASRFNPNEHRYRWPTNAGGYMENRYGPLDNDFGAQVLAPIQPLMNDESNYCSWGHCSKWDIVTFLALSSNTTREDFRRLQEFLMDKAFKCDHPTAMNYIFTWFGTNATLDYRECSDKDECTRVVEQSVTYEQVVAEYPLDERLLDGLMQMDAAPGDTGRDYFKQNYHLLRRRLPNTQLGSVVIMYTNLNVRAAHVNEAHDFASRIHRLFKLVFIGNADTVEMSTYDHLMPFMNDVVVFDTPGFDELDSLMPHVTPCMLCEKDDRQCEQRLIALLSAKDDDGSTVAAAGLSQASVYAIICASVLLALLIAGLLVVAVYLFRVQQRTFRDQIMVVFKQQQQRGDSVRSQGAEERYSQPLPSNASRKADQWELDRSRFKVHYDQKLGSGAFSHVYKGYIEGETPVRGIYPNVMALKEHKDVPVAVKLLPEHADFNAKGSFLAEINFMKELGYHRNLLSMLGCVTLEDPICLTTEYCAHGDLLHLVRDRKIEILQAEPDAFLTPTDLLSFGWQIADGLAYLGRHGCVHRDVAARNVLVNASKVAMLGDFGLCRQLERTIYTTQGGRLPIKWMAIESLVHYEYTSQSDVLAREKLNWSFGVLLYEVLSLGDVPYSWVQPADMADHLLAGRRLARPQLADPPIYALMRRCWEQEPKQRPSFDEIHAQLGEHMRGCSMLNANYGYLDPTELPAARRTRSGSGSASPASLSDDDDDGSSNLDDIDVSSIQSGSIVVASPDQLQATCPLPRLH